MEPNLTLGILLAVFSGFLQGTILLPMKFARTWKWENTWIIFAAFAYFLLPWVFAAITIPSLTQIYGGARFEQTLTVALFGLAWGVAAVLFGLGCDALGMALGFAVILGLGTAAGSLVPLALLSPEKMFQPEGIRVMVGVAVMVAGVAVCAWAGKLRDDVHRVQGGDEFSAKRHSFYMGLLFAVISGLLNPLINFALVFGSDLTQAAIALGARQQYAPNTLWTLIGTAGFIPNALYCAYLLRSNRTARLFWAAPRKGRNFFLAFLMGLVWISGMAIYGSSTVVLGRLGPSVGWPIFMASLIVSSNIWGVVLGEWKVGGKPLTTLYAGLAVLVGSIFVIGVR